jgi:hypothetical protein
MLFFDLAAKGSSGLVLPSTRGADMNRILEALDELEAGGSTNGAEGIQLAYQTARQNFLRRTRPWKKPSTREKTKPNECSCFAQKTVGERAI